MHFTSVVVSFPPARNNSQRNRDIDSLPPSSSQFCNEVHITRIIGCLWNWYWYVSLDVPPKIHLLIELSNSSVLTQDVCNQITITINSQSDADLLADCSTISAAIFISPSASGEISFDGPTEIDGFINATNVESLTGLTSSTISNITALLALSSLPILSILEFDVLESVGVIEWSNLPSLSSFNFGAVETDFFAISNTLLSSIKNIGTGPASYVQITNNPQLTSIELGFTNISTLNIYANGNSPSISFPDLVELASSFVADSGQLKVPSLTNVGGFEITNVTSTSFEAPKLASADANLLIDWNNALTEVSLPLLTSVGGDFRVDTNDVLDKLSFPALKDVGGLILLNGTFSTYVAIVISTMQRLMGVNRPSLPELSSVKGAFDLESTDTSVDCSSFQADAANGIIQGPFTCQGSTATEPSSPSISTHPPIEANPPTHKSVLSMGAKIGIGVGIPLFLIVVGALILIWEKGYKLSFQKPAEADDYPLETELPLGGHHEKTELPVGRQPTQVAQTHYYLEPELPLGGHHEKTELHAQGRPAELSATAWGPVPEAHELYIGEEKYHAK